MKKGKVQTGIIDYYTEQYIAYANNIVSITSLRKELEKFFQKLLEKRKHTNCMY